ncbi:Coenzyme F420 hydrogenase/dehydrogenase, beta subunit C-terminal domain [Solidesulfovibrio sp.]|uniref:Coenzyme F420 hydrogenase/dehydrogenase, beta subunit C-terminal domain n=1 Tax=Solidesulfovibrio sp. TaxID=2910990 RepID=UPI0017C66571|nr:Coenzyme F420 hydrogenase/dehydrogenase, beta subunit C-terminal domain [Solidesulfovibrio sp.]MEA5087844.1 Coenzyme F420 hydrogenase/dehydrogenase, beta subunit C-terminal domain [Solidesulfovibrio sp.]NMC48849.1 formate dehydrogenase [Desulfovibrio sp.]HML59316.1 Coenzyme F420 hydrogenase/dehydrogenase, beta subunit C-terminal domain [Solidesulfovibrio sp.]
MSTTMKIEVPGEGPTAALRGVLAKLLEIPDVAAIFSLRHTPGGAAMPALITDPDLLADADPLAPAFPVNAATILARLTRGGTEGIIAAVLRPCEIRAFVELVKLNQGNLENVLLLGMDCPGAFGNADYREFAIRHGTREVARTFLRRMLSGEPSDDDGPDVARACRVCEHPVAAPADGTIGLFGNDPEKVMLVVPQTAKGLGLLRRLDLPAAEEALAANRDAALASCVAERVLRRDAMFAETGAAVDGLEKLGAYLAGCVNCYNCRVACPVCYCRECVFVTDVFDHSPWEYLNWARRKGALKLPADTLFYHMTRLAHMSLACVGCGQCSNACPSGVPVMELFRTVAAGAQAAFGYEAGRSPEEAPPLSLFQEREFAEVTAGAE